MKRSSTALGRELIESKEFGTHSAGYGGAAAATLPIVGTVPLGAVRRGWRERLLLALHQLIELRGIAGVVGLQCPIGENHPHGEDDTTNHQKRDLIRTDELLY